MESPFDDHPADSTQDGSPGPGWAWQAGAAFVGVLSAAVTRWLLNKGRKRLLRGRDADAPKKGRTTVLWTATMAAGAVVGRNALAAGTDGAVAAAAGAGFWVSRTTAR